MRRNTSLDKAIEIKVWWDIFAEITFENLKKMKLA